VRTCFKRKITSCRIRTKADCGVKWANNITSFFMKKEKHRSEFPKSKDKAEKYLLYAGFVHLTSPLPSSIQPQIIRGRLGFWFKSVFGFSSSGLIPAVFEKLDARET
jgi:hypothetical protein